MHIIFAFALIAAAHEPDYLERSLAETCGEQVLDRSRIKVMHGDSRVLIYDDRLPSEKIKCLVTWAASWRERLANGVDTYASPRYPLGPYDIPPELRNRP